jgi:indolepyruvate ferredoxin oxidoreductase beta subunit
LISKLIGEAMLEDGYWVTIGETYGASQRGGSVASHIRISKKTQHGPLTPEGRADIILGLEPVESLRMLCLYGNPKTSVITNIRPIHPMAVAIGEAEYPSLEMIKQGIRELSREAWYLDASEIAIGLGAPLLTNMVMVGALIGSGLIPLEEEKFMRQLEMNFEKERLSSNLKAITLGVSTIRKQKRTYQN